MITNNLGVITYVNRSFENITGYSSIDVIDKTPAILKSGHHDTNFYRQLWNTIYAGKVFQGEFVNAKKDGGLFYESKKIIPVLDPQGQISSFVSLTEVVIS